MNSHVYLYFRWLGWCAENSGNLWSAELYRGFAELEKQ